MEEGCNSCESDENVEGLGIDRVKEDGGRIVDEEQDDWASEA